MQPQQPVQGKPKIHWMWWIIAIGLLIWNIFSFLPKSRPEVNIPYSVFIQQVSAGNVASVHISGSEITGKFTRAIPDPQATPSAAAGGNAALLVGGE